MTCTASGGPSALHGRCWLGVTVLLVLVPASDARGVPVDGAGQEAPSPAIEDPPRRAVSWAEDGGATSLLVPALEVPALNVGVWGVAKLLGKPYADITFEIMWDHITKGPWIWDDDPYIANQLGHPYQGSLAFTSARSSGWGFWSSIPFALVSTVMWELLMETEDPSKNDLITTTVGGIVLGEILHRLSLLVLDEGNPGVWRWLSSALVSPVGAFNHFFFGRRENDFYPHETYFARFLGGVSSDVLAYTEIGPVREDDRSAPQLLFGVDVTSGLPGDPKLRLRRPFEHFSASARVGVVQDLWAAMFLRGLLAGARFDSGELKGLFGLFSGYDFATQNTLRVTTVSLGFGASAQYRTQGSLYLLPTAVVSGVPFGAGGSLRNPIGNRDYQYGPGLQVHAGLQFVVPGVFRAGAAGRFYRIYGEFFGEGAESIWYATFSAEAAVGAFHAVGLEAMIADRSAKFGGQRTDTHQRSSQVALYWSVMTDAGFGAFLGDR